MWYKQKYSRISHTPLSLSLFPLHARSPILQCVPDNDVPTAAEHEKDKDVRQGNRHVVNVPRLADLGPAAIRRLEVLFALGLGRPGAFLLAQYWRRQRLMDKSTAFRKRGKSRLS